jgi:hypothetical protein
MRSMVEGAHANAPSVSRFTLLALDTSPASQGRTRMLQQKRKPAPVARHGFSLMAIRAPRGGACRETRCLKSMAALH